ncbi:NAD-dependent epimerase/dehydratase family protein [Jiangella asiatica]|nr:NAD-dependent epimerase/dehydratase family protein [Jiangella asiatica]
MHIFLTGGTGFVGAGIARALLARGHDVTALARSEASAGALRSTGVRPCHGSLDDVDAVRRHAERADAVVHAAFSRHYLDDVGSAVTTDRAATHAILDALRGSRKPFAYTSGLGVVGDTGDRIIDEDTPLQPPSHMRWRRALELSVLDGEHGIVIRPPLVYGRGGGHVLQIMIRTALRRGAASYPEPGTNAWPNVHVDDLGRAFAQALEEAPPSTVLNVVGGESTPKAVSEAIGRLVGRPEATFALPLDRARRELPIVDWLTVTQRIDARRVRALLGWRPAEAAIEDDIAVGSYRRFVRPVPEAPAT